MRITAGQIESFRGANWRNLCARIARHLRENFLPHIEAQGIDPERIAEVLHPELQQAHRTGFVTERDLRIYAEGCAALGLYFLQDPAHGALRSAVDSAAPGEPKARLVVEAMILAELREMKIA